MLHHPLRVAGLLAIAAMLALAPATLAAPASKGSAAAKSKERAYGKHCGSKKAKPRSARAKCLDAMAKLDRNPSLSPAKVCRGLSRKKAKGERKSAYARCVSEGAKLLKAKNRAGSKSGGSAPADDAAAGHEADPPDGGDAVDDIGSTPLHELLPEDFLSADELDPDF